MAECLQLLQITANLDVLGSEVRVLDPREYANFLQEQKALFAQGLTRLSFKALTSHFPSVAPPRSSDPLRACTKTVRVQPSV